MSETQTWWLSFVDRDRPAGQRFLGASVVDVTEADRDEAAVFVTRRRVACGLPPLAATDEAIWMAAAIRKAHALGCNPGGEVGSVRLDRHPDFAANDRYPRGQVLSRAAIAALE